MTANTSILSWSSFSQNMGSQNGTSTVSNGYLSSAPPVLVQIIVSLSNTNPNLSTLFTLTGAVENNPYMISYATLAAAAEELVWVPTTSTSGIFNAFSVKARDFISTSTNAIDVLINVPAQNLANQCRRD